MRKRRIFDLDMPEQEAGAASGSGAMGGETFPAGKIPAAAEPDRLAEGAPAPARRRGPMATAVQENAEALRERARSEAAIRAENDALAAEFVRLQGLGLIVDMLPVDAIDTRKLLRDRITGDDLELAELKQSIRDVGLSNPIRVVPAAGGRYELVQGLRRLSAYRELRAETGDDRFAMIPAGMMTDAEGLEQLYRRMVDENLVRKDVSFLEMATLARHYALDPSTGCDDPDKAVTILFGSAGSQKRSYIRAFVTLVDRLGEALLFPQEVPRDLGLALRRRLEAEPGIVEAIKAELQDWGNRSVQDELDVLRRWAGAGEGDETFPAGKIPEGPARSGARRAKVTFDVPQAEGPAKCTAANGRLEVRLPLDFSTIDRRRLEAAVRRMLEQIR